MNCCSCNPVPTLGASSVAVSGTSATITVSGTLPTTGRFNLKFCGQCVPVCSTATTVTITDGTTTYKTVLTRCGTNLSLPALAYQIKRFCVAHFCGSTTMTGTAILQDKLACNVTVYSDTAAAASAEAVVAPASSKKA